MNTQDFKIQNRQMADSVEGRGGIVGADSDSYGDGFATGQRFREMEERGWDPGNTILATMINHKDDPDYLKGFEAGLVAS